MFTHSLIFAMTTQIAAIDGQVLDARTHAVIPFAAVEISGPFTSISREYTDRDGRFAFAALVPGRYVISVDCPGYEPMEFDTPAGVTSTAMTIELNRRKTPSTNIRPTVSVREFTNAESAGKEFDRGRKS